MEPQNDTRELKSDKESSSPTENDSKHTEEPLRPKHAVILPVLLLIFVGIGMMAYLMTEWTQYTIRNELFPNSTNVKHFSACSVTNKSDPTYKAYETVQQKTATWSMYYAIAMNVPTFFINLIVPTYMDTYGRRFLFILSSAGLLIKTAIVTIVVFLKGHFIFIAVAVFVEGITGSTFSMYCAMFSFVADITVSDNYRVLGIVIVEATLMVTATISGALTGIMVETPSLGYEYTSLIATVLMGVGFVIAAVFLPETLDKHKRAPKPASVFSTVKRTLEFYISKEFKGVRVKYIILLLSFFFTIQTQLNRSSVETIYLLGQPFCWGPSQVGYFSLAQQAGRGLVGLASVKLFQQCFSNEVISIISLISIILSFLIEAFATSDVMIYSVAVAAVFSFIVIPMIRGMMSTITPADKQGAMFASISAVEVVGSVTGSLIVNGIYSATMSIMNGFVFLVLAGISVINFILLLVNKFVKAQPADVEFEVLEEIKG